jgi:hypothetical protein
MIRSFILLTPVFLIACDSDGRGTARFTTWGEELIEEGIGPLDPAAPDEPGFVDGWTIKYDRFLVNVTGIGVGRAGATPVATWNESKLVDHVKPGPKDLVTFPDLPAQRFEQVTYEIRPPVASTALVGVTEADRAAMMAGNFAVFVEGAATKGTMRKTFRWGFPIATRYENCEAAAESGRPAPQGIVIGDGATDVSELTIHGDHLFYDRLRTSDDPAVKTSLRFDALAAADKDGDGEVTMAELTATPIDVRLYDPSGFEAPNLGAFVTALARTVGHFRGEGECSVKPLP